MVAGVCPNSGSTHLFKLDADMAEVVEKTSLDRR